MERQLSLFSSSSSVLRQQRQLPGLLALPRAPLRPQRVLPTSPLAISIPLPLGKPQSSSQVAAPTAAPEEVSRVTTVHSPEELTSILEQNKDKLVVLMCKAKGCKPCRMFMRKYRHAAEIYADAIFLEIYGDETKDTRKLMVEMAIKVTPTFVLHRGGEKVHSHGGVNEGNLHKAIAAQLKPSEAGANYKFVDEGEQTDED